MIKLEYEKNVIKWGGKRRSVCVYIAILPSVLSRVEKERKRKERKEKKKIKTEKISSQVVLIDFPEK